jgi:hypothetical protein
MRHSIRAGLAARIQLEYLAAQIDAFARHARAVGGGPAPGITVLSAVDWTM